MLKQRSGSVVTLSGLNAVNYSGVGGLGSGNITIEDITYTPWLESMNSTYGRFKTFNFCDHLKYSQVYLNPLMVYKTDPNPPDQTQYYNQSNRLVHLIGADRPGTTEAVLDTWFLESFPSIDLDQSTWRDLSGKAVQTMWPAIEKSVDESIINTIIELPQLTKIASTLSRLSSLAQLSSLTLKKLIGASANASLSYEFGIKPLLSDIIGYTNAMRLARSGIQRLLRNEGKILRSHCSFPIEVRGGTDQSRTRQVGNFSNEYLRYILSLDGKATYTCTIKYSYTLSDWEKRNIDMLGFLDTIGAMNDPQILWNALPFSFLVDYVAKIGNFVGQFKGRGIDPVVTIHDACHSAKLEYNRQLDIEVFGIPTSYDKRTCHTMRYSRYIREPFTSATIAQLDLSNLSKYKIRMIGTLLLASFR
jgi:hypothetical protein